MKRLWAGLAGLVFALGLGLSGMARPVKVLGFLDFSGAWDPSLLCVMGGALLVHAPFVRYLRRRRPSPLLAASRAPIDVRLVAGAAVFGVGWGLSGLCPGPALVDLAQGGGGIVAFVAAMFVGSALALPLEASPGSVARDVGDAGEGGFETRA